jgi:hypothetical protein
VKLRRNIEVREALSYAGKNTRGIFLALAFSVREIEAYAHYRTVPNPFRH